MRFLKYKKIKETAIQILKDKGHMNAQAEFLIKGNNPWKFKLKDVAPGLIINTMTPRAARYIRKRKLMYILSSSTQNEFRRRAPVRFGFQENLLRSCLKSKNCVESKDFQEMELRERWNYDMSGSKLSLTIQVQELKKTKYKKLQLKKSNRLHSQAVNLSS